MSHAGCLSALVPTRPALLYRNCITVIDDVASDAKLALLQRYRQPSSHAGFGYRDGAAQPDRRSMSLTINDLGPDGRLSTPAWCQLDDLRRIDRVEFGLWHRRQLARARGAVRNEHLPGISARRTYETLECWSAEDPASLNEDLEM